MPVDELADLRAELAATRAALDTVCIAHVAVMSAAIGLGGTPDVTPAMADGMAYSTACTVAAVCARNSRMAAVGGAFRAAMVARAVAAVAADPEPVRPTPRAG